MTIDIRKMQEQDIGLVHTLGRREKYFCGFWPEEILRNIVDSPDASAYVAEVNKSLAGFVIGSYSPTLRKMSVENIYVVPEFRREYSNRDVVAGHLASTIIQDARDRGAQRIDCLVDTTNTLSRNLCNRKGIEFSDQDYKWGTMKP